MHLCIIFLQQQRDYKYWFTKCFYLTIYHDKLAHFTKYFQSLPFQQKAPSSPEFSSLPVNLSYTWFHSFFYYFSCEFNPSATTVISTSTNVSINFLPPPLVQTSSLTQLPPSFNKQTNKQTVSLEQEVLLLLL